MYSECSRQSKGEGGLGAPVVQGEERSCHVQSLSHSNKLNNERQAVA
jgi:hypothetical protein